MTHSAAPPVVIAIDSFKGSIRAADAAHAIAEGWRSVEPGREIILCPMADGGEGTLEAFAAAIPGAQQMSSWLLLPATHDAPNGTGVVELASTSGIELLGTPPKLRPWDADTRGFGEAIAAALTHGVSRLILGIGSSASTDGGAGMLTALGAHFTDAAGRPIAPGARGLATVAHVHLQNLAPLPPGGVTVLTDVTSPLLGERGAAAVFGPQKGATPGDIPLLDTALARYADLLEVDPDSPGAGAAGGTGFGLLAWGAHLVPGAPAVAQLIDLPARLAAASLVITGEGSFDASSAAGKTVAYVQDLATTHGVPVALVAGHVAADVPRSGLLDWVSLTDLAGSSARALAEPARWLRNAGSLLARRLNG
ncbi:glycerate kinase [Microbacterium sp. ET2]|uniref:glycerate kinase n=1 Tax=Microbacterium albipurpureum TaxID=3050384 RepID=UPI00259C997D|nr:glycerate kinase [Microbacterium sp. ET2 (Ac-2212)]WJL94870.1 glycerate kinase [Microbacterium sp. ET2 (Ac-2212)]